MDDPLQQLLLEKIHDYGQALMDMGKDMQNETAQLKAAMKKAGEIIELVKNDLSPNKNNLL